MSWTINTTPPTWNVKDTELLNRMIYALLENGNADASTPTLITSMFSIQQLIDALNIAQERFMRDTGAVIARATEASTQGIARYSLPSDWIFTRRCAWQDTSGTSQSLTRTDAYALDHGLPDWQQNLGPPVAYNDGSDLPTLTLEIAYPPSDAGTLYLDYVAQPVALTGAGVNLTVPDECESAVMYLALAQLYGQDGEAHDPERAAYCRQRYDLAMEFTNLLLGGGPEQ